MRVLGLDPGTVRTGWGVVERDGPRLRHLAAGVIRVPERLPLHERLHRIHDGLVQVIAQSGAQAVAVEDIFYAKHANAALKLGHVRGVTLLAVTRAGLEVHAYPPAVVKKAVVGRGRADKRQVARLVGAILRLKELPGEDATDALAIAIAHLSRASIRP
ncbi:MAG: crossover junction endodeoxyribonuclease RuvC [Myxococcota bacterium]